MLTLQVFSLFPCTLAQETYWGYVPEAPLFHPATWDSEDIKIVSNNSFLLGGECLVLYTPAQPNNLISKDIQIASPYAFLPKQQQPLYQDACP